MKFVEQIAELQNKNEGYVVIVQRGIFFVALGKDAVFLNKELGLKISCEKEGWCKVGFPISGAEKYIQILKNKNIPYIFFEKEEGDLIESFKRDGDFKIPKNDNIKLNCLSCSNRKLSTKESIEKLKEMSNK